MEVVALDLSLSATGVAEVGRTGTIRPPPGMRGVERLRWIRDAVTWEIEDADLVVIEGYSFASRGRAVVSIGELGGVIRCALDDLGTEWVAIPPSCVKKLATSKGNAGKELVLVEAVKRLGYGGSDHNQADAMWLLQAALIHYGLPGAVSLPKTHLAALDKVQWPEVTVEAL